MRLFLGVLCVLAIGGCSDKSAYAAERLQIPGSRYSVSMPGKATCEESTIQAVWGPAPRHSCSYFDAAAARGYLLEFMELPSVPPANQRIAMLKAAVAGAASMTESEIQKERQFDASGYPAIEGVMVAPKSGFIAVVNYILIENHLVTVSVEGGREAMGSEDFRNYLDSFLVSPASD
jgi:hypothetical protein